jgi:hypothetical protein
VDADMLRNRRAFLTLLANQGAVEPFPLNYFPSQSPVTLYEDYDGSYLFLQPVTTNRYWRVKLSGTITVGGEFLHIVDKNIVKTFGGFKRGGAGVTTSGVWTGPVAGTYFAREYNYSTATNAYIQIVTADGVTECGVHTIGAGAGGPLVKVTIDSDNTLADLIPTAQQYVDGGTFPNTILVANGGSLNPTDRCYDTNAVATRPIMFTRSLSAGVHTIRLTNTGYKTAGSGNTAMFFSAFIVFGEGLYDVSQAYAEFDEVQNQASGFVSDEISWSFRPTGATVENWCGHANSLKFLEAPTFTADGAAQTPTYLTRYTGSEMIINCSLGVRHTETGETNHGTLTLQFKMNNKGLTITHSLAWSGTGTVWGYPCMWTVDRTVLDKGASYIGVVDLNNAGTVKANTSLNKIWAYDANGNQGTVMTITSLTDTVANWAQNATPTERLFWLDVIPKAYAKRINSANPVSYTSATVFTSEANYRTAWLADTNVLTPP